MPDLVISSHNGVIQTHLCQGYDPIWTRDGKQLFFTSSNKTGWNIGIWDGKAMRTIDVPTHNEGFVYPCPSPDGRLIVFDMKAADGSMQLGTVTTEGTNVRQLTRTGTFNQRPAYSPDGRYIAFNRGKSTPASLILFDTQSGTERVLANNIMVNRPIWFNISETRRLNGKSPQKGKLTTGD